MKLLRLKSFIILFCVTLGLAYLISGFMINTEVHYQPTVAPADLLPILEKNTLSEEDYLLLYEQTGIAKPIVDELRTMPDFIEKMLTFQSDYLAEVRTDSDYLPPITFEDKIVNAEDERIPGFSLAPYHNGYILFTKATHTANWRHGHAAIVIDEVRGITLEALSPGTISMEQNINKWRYYSNFKMMRLKDVPQTVLNEIADYASTYLKGLPYNILADKNQGEAPKDTHCALLVWQAFKPFGFDLDSTGGLFVSPKNMATSPLLETLQIYGFNPHKDW